MSFQLVSFWCAACRAATPHEYDEYTQRSQCVTCANKTKLRHPRSFQNEPNMSAARVHAALDGLANRGEGGNECATSKRKRRTAPSA